MSAVRLAARDRRDSVYLHASDAAFLDCDSDETYTDCAGRTVPVGDTDTAHLDLSFVWDRLLGFDIAASDFFSLVDEATS